MHKHSLFLSIALLCSFPAFASDGKSAAAAAASAAATASSAAAVVAVAGPQMKVQAQQTKTKEAQSLQAFEAEQRAAFAQQHPEFAEYGNTYLQQRFESSLALSEEDTKAGTALVAQLNPNLHVDQNKVPGYKSTSKRESYTALIENYAGLEKLLCDQFPHLRQSERFLWLKMYSDAKVWQRSCTGLILYFDKNKAKLARQQEANERRGLLHYRPSTKPAGFVEPTVHTSPLSKVTQDNWINYY
jgi:hypothetical protein